MALILLLRKNASSIKNITVFIPKNHPINREIRLTQLREHKNITWKLQIWRKTTITENNHYVQICTTHKKYSQPFDPNYTHTL